jgi:hypothetical protein
MSRTSKKATPDVDPLYAAVCAKDYHRADQLCTGSVDIVQAGADNETVFHRLCLDIPTLADPKQRLAALSLLKNLASTHYLQLDGKREDGKTAIYLAVENAIKELKASKRNQDWSSLCAAAILFENNAETHIGEWLTYRLIENDLANTNRKAFEAFYYDTDEFIDDHLKKLRRTPTHNIERSLAEVANTLFRHTDRHARMAYVLLNQDEARLPPESPQRSLTTSLEAKY